MEEVVFIVFTMNEAITLLLVEHFDCSLHKLLTFLVRSSNIGTNRGLLYHPKTQNGIENVKISCQKSL
jgi:hypothetical protein